MNNKRRNDNTAAEDEPFQQIAMSLDPSGARQEETQQAGNVPARVRRLPVEGLCGTDSRRASKTEYVMRMLVSGRALPEEPPAPAAPEPPQQSRRPAAPQPPQQSRRPAAPQPPPGVITLENLTFDDLLAELENL